MGIERGRGREKKKKEKEDNSPRLSWRFVVLL